MVNGQNITIDHLVKIAQTIRTEGRTGSLVVTRGEGTNYELGTLVFFNGRVVQARSGRYEGREALNYLLMWGKCRYTFINPAASVTNLHAQQQFMNREPQPQGRIHQVKLVPIGQAQQQLPLHPSEYVTEPLPKLQQHQITQEVVRVSPEEARQVNEAVPYINRSLQDGLRLLSERGLSRIHRHVLLLIDGSRRVGDLMRLLKLSDHQMLILLSDLQRTGIIVLSSPSYVR